MIRKAIIKLLKRKLKINALELKWIEKEYGYLSPMDSDWYIYEINQAVECELNSLLKTIKQVSTK